jgi:outer membrane lipoprotein-sorting protein
MLILTYCVWSEPKAGSFVFETDGQTYRLRANEAPVNDILEDISLKTDIPLCLDDRNTTTVSVDTKRGTLEELLDDLSSSYSIVYIKDPETATYRIERIVATSSDGEITAQCKLQEGEMRRQKVMQAIRNAVLGIERYSEKAEVSMNMNLPMDIPMFPGGQVKQSMQMWMDSGKYRVEAMLEGMEGMLEGMQHMEGMDELGKTITVCDGEKVYSYVPMINMVTVYDMEKLKQAMGPDFASELEKTVQPFANLDEDRMEYMGIETLNGKSMYVLEGPIKEEVREYTKSIAESVADQSSQQAFEQSGGDMDKTQEVSSQVQEMVASMMPDSGRIWVSTQDGMIRKYTFKNVKGDEAMKGEFDEVRIDPPMDPALFEFETPADATVNDITEMMIDMIGAAMGTTPDRDSAQPE